MLEAFLGIIFMCWLISVMFNREKELPKEQQLNLKEGSNDVKTSYKGSLGLVLILFAIAAGLALTLLAGAGG